MEGRPSQESVQYAAVSYNGEIFAGATHGDATLAFLGAHPGMEESTELLISGYLTTTGRFVTLEEGRGMSVKDDQQYFP